MDSAESELVHSSKDKLAKTVTLGTYWRLTGGGLSMQVACVTDCPTMLWFGLAILSSGQWARGKIHPLSHSSRS